MRKGLYEAQGADRLKLWLEYTQLQDEDPELRVNQCQPSLPVRAVYADLWVRQDWMTSCVPFLKLHSWSLDDPKHPKVVFNVITQPVPLGDAVAPFVVSPIFPAWSHRKGTSELAPNVCPQETLMS